MKNFIYILFILVIISCSNENSYHAKYKDIVPITTYKIPDSTLVSDTIEISATAAQSTDCWSDLYFVFSEAADSVHLLTAYGTFETYGNCNSASILKDTLINFVPSKVGTYIFYFAMNRYNIIEDSVIVYTEK